MIIEKWDLKAELEKARYEGAEEAWRFIHEVDESDWNEDILCFDTYAEAKSAFENWRTKWEPKVGDVVAIDDKRGVILTISSCGDITVLWGNTWTGRFGKDNELVFTGEHIDLSNVFNALNVLETC